MVTGNHSVAHFSDGNPELLLKWIGKYGMPNIFHSHPCAAVPSYEDLTYMTTTIPLFDCVWFIMSDKMMLRAWTISFGSSEFTGKKLRFPQRGETIRPVEVEVEII